MELVERFHNKAAAEAAYQDFVQRFQKNQIPDEMPEVEIKVPSDGMAIANVLKNANLVATTSEALRMIDQKAVRIDGDTIEDKKALLMPGKEYVCQVGKRKFARIKLNA
jgi:tyrosyl-tRNA synthetase